MVAEANGSSLLLWPGALFGVGQCRVIEIAEVIPRGHDAHPLESLHDFGVRHLERTKEQQAVEHLEIAEVALEGRQVVAARW